MAMNIPLKTAFLISGTTQQEVASETGIHYTRLSKIVRGWLKPNAAEKRLIAKALRRQQDELFRDEVGVA